MIKLTMDLWTKFKPKGRSGKLHGVVVLLCVLFFMPSVYAQSVDQTSMDVKVHGQVVDESGEPLSGVTVLITKTFKGTITDADGNYSITIPKILESKNLSFVFLGMKPQVISVPTSRELNVVMKVDGKEIDEVVVTGYQSISHRDMAGAATTLKAKDIENPAFTSIDKMLEGQVAGMIVTNTSTRATGSADIKIRGTSTILGNTNPLWVVDGIIQPDPIAIDPTADLAGDLNNIVGSAISWLNPSDISTISVLKDASATAIYGSRASNGVIVVTTKKGVSGKTKVSYGLTTSFRNAPNYGDYNLMNSQERIEFSQEAYNAGMIYNNKPQIQNYTYEGLLQQYMNHDITKDQFSNQLNYLQTTNTDWLGMFTQNSISQTHNVTISGGTQKLTYLSSLSYSNNKGVEIGDQMKRVTGRLRVSAELAKNLNLDLNVSVSQNTNDGFGAGVNPMSYATTYSRALPAYNQDGSPAYYTTPSQYAYNSNVQGYNGTGLGYNEANEIANSSSQNKNTAINSSLNLKWQFLPMLRYELVVGLNQQFLSSNSYMGENTFYISNRYRGYLPGEYLPGSAPYNAAILPFGGELFVSNGTQGTYNVQNKLIFEKTYNKIHRINALVMTEARSQSLTQETNTSWGYSPDRGQQLFKPTSPDKLVPIGGSGIYDGFGVLDKTYKGGWARNSQTNNYFSMMGTLVYTLKDRYVLNASIRTEDSNRYNQDISRRFEPIWSFGVAWNFTDEEFLKSQLSWLNQGKLRMSYGTQGNTLTNISPNLIINQGTFDPVYGQFTSKVSSLPNPYLNSERTKQFDTGLDMRLFKFVTVSLDYFYKSSNTIASLNVPLENGFVSSNVNGGKVINEGYEYTFTFSPIRKKDMAWNISINGGKTYNKGEFSNLRSTTQYLPVGQYLSGSQGGTVLKAGYDVNSFWSYSFKGIDPKTGAPTFNNLDKASNTVSDPTDYLVYSGKTTPDFSGGLSSSFRYKGFTLAAHFVMELGRSIRLYNPYIYPFSAGYMVDPLYNLDKELDNRWKKPGDESNTLIPGLPVGGILTVMNLPDGQTDRVYAAWGNSDARVASGNFLRCNNLSLSYRLNADFLKKYNVSDFSLTGSVSNLFVLASKDLQGFDPELRERAVAPKTVSLGLNIAF